MNRTPTIALCLSLFGACGDDAKTGDTSDVTINEVATSVDIGADAVSGCDIDNAVSGPQTEAGLELTLCGARLTVAAGAVPVGTTIGLKIVAAPGPVPFEREAIGNIITVLSVSDFKTPAQLFMPDTNSAGGYREGANYEPAVSGWLGFEACPADGGVIFDVTFGGTYALLRDTVVFPASPQELGSGTLEATFMGDKVTWDFEDGYAIHDLGNNGLRSVTAIARMTPDGGQLQQLDVRLSEAADHSYTPLQVSLIDTADTSGGWSWLEPVHGPAMSSSVIAVQGDRVVGTMTIELHKGEEVQTMTIAIDLQTGRYRFPPEASCFPEG